MLQYSNETLENIIKDQRSDKFNFIVNQKSFEVPLSFALGISPLITEEYVKDPTFREFKITINISDINKKELSEKEIQKDFSYFLQGQKISREIFYQIGLQLKNKEMIKKYYQNQNQTQNKDNMLKKLKHIQESQDLFHNQMEKFEFLEEEFNYIAEHLGEMKEEVQQLNDDELLFILKNEKIQIENENLIWKIIHERIIKHCLRKNQKEQNNQINRNHKSLFMGIIQASYLKNEYMREYIEMIDEEDIERESQILKKIKQILLSNIDNLQSERDEKEIKTGRVFYECEHKNGQNFRGIIDYLEEKYGKNIHSQGIITISASSSFHNTPDKVIDYNWNDCWHSNSNPGNWLEVNFQHFQVKIKGYSLMTQGGSKNMVHLKNWILEGSNNRRTWIELDKQENNDDLNGSLKQHYYPVFKEKEKEFQYLRIRSIGFNHFNDHRLLIKNIEFFGTLIKNEEE